MPSFSPGALVSARNREWVVLETQPSGVLLLRPVDGLQAEVTGILPELEPGPITSTDYPLPDSTKAGNLTSAVLLRDAARMALRSGAGPFRSLGRISVTPRPYQFVPLLMALRLNPIRMLIADDVGVGKTIEAAMIARELLDRGLVRRVGVLCPPHLCEQWEAELRHKFGIDAVVIQPSRMGQLIRDLPRQDLSVYRYYPHLVASIDFVKSDRNRKAFVDNAPDFIIVDEAHGDARPRGQAGSGQHQRYELLRELAAKSDRHIVLVTATPHSGIEESFRSLLGLLNQEFDAPEEVALPRARLLPHLVQRRRSDIAAEHLLGEGSPFPERLPLEELSYNMSAGYQTLFQDVLAYCQKTVSAPGLRQQQQRVRYWAAIAILRCLLSSPAAAEAMLEQRKHRTAANDTGGDSSARVLASQLFDTADEDEPSDYAPAAALEDPEVRLSDPELALLDRFLKTARGLAGVQHDRKLARAAEAVADLLQAGHSPIVYCRFIATARYVADHLQGILRRAHPGIKISAVTGDDGSSEQRAELVAQLAQASPRVLVATECLSEGINLQDHFDAVVHYDLPWNPNRLEQREGRVDRYGQPSKKVRRVLLYGADNMIDLTVLDVLIRKANLIRNRLGVSVPVPVDSEEVVQAIVRSVLLRGQGHLPGRQLSFAFESPEVASYHQRWDAAADEEDKFRSFFRQQGIQPETIARELEEMAPVLGDQADLRRFMAEALQRFGGALEPTRTAGVFRLHPGDFGDRLGSQTNLTFPLLVAFDGVPPSGVLLLGRTHSIVAALAEGVLGKALVEQDPLFARCGAVFTQTVDRRTAVVTLRLRYVLEERRVQQFAEEVVVAAFRRATDGSLQWLEPFQEQGVQLLSGARATADMAAPERRDHVTWALGMLKDEWYQSVIQERVKTLQDAHARLRDVTKSAPLTVTPHEPPDVLGCYVLVPSGGGR